MHAPTASRQAPPHGYAVTDDLQGVTSDEHGPPPDLVSAAQKVPAAALPGSHADFRQLPPTTARRRGGGWGWRWLGIF